MVIRLPDVGPKDGPPTSIVDSFWIIDPIAYQIGTDAL